MGHASALAGSTASVTAWAPSVPRGGAVGGRPGGPGGRVPTRMMLLVRWRADVPPYDQAEDQRRQPVRAPGEGLVRPVGGPRGDGGACVRAQFGGHDPVVRWRRRGRRLERIAATVAPTHPAWPTAHGCGADSHPSGASSETSQAANRKPTGASTASRHGRPVVSIFSMLVKSAQAVDWCSMSVVARWATSVVDRWVTTTTPSRRTTPDGESRTSNGDRSRPSRHANAVRPCAPAEPASRLSAPGTARGIVIRTSLVIRG